MKQFKVLLLSLLFGKILFAQTSTLVQPAIKIKGKVVSDILVPGHEFVYLFTNYELHNKDSALIQFDSTFEFSIANSSVPLAFSVSYKNSVSCALLPKIGEINLQVVKQEYPSKDDKRKVVSQNDYQYYHLENLVKLPMNLVENKSFALLDSVDFNKDLLHLLDSATNVLRIYQDSLHPLVYKEFERWLNLNSQIAYLDFALLKRLHQKEKTFDRVSIDYTKAARRLLLDSNQLSFAKWARIMLKVRVQALEAIDFQTSRFNPFEYQCEQINMEVLRKASPQSDGLNCDYGLVGAVSFYLIQEQYQSGWLIPPRFEKLSYFSNKYAIVVYNGRVGVIDACQNFTVQPNYSVLKEFKVYKNDSLPPLYIFRGAKNYGLLDHTGRQLLEENYDYLFQLDAARLAYRPINGNKFGMMDTNGKIIMTPKYDIFYSGNMMPGYFKVSNQHPFLKVKRRLDGERFFKPAELIGLIDSLGNEIVKPGWNDFNYMYMSYGQADGINWIGKKYHVLSRTLSTKKFGYISSNGFFILKPIYKNIFSATKSGQYVVAKKAKKYYIYFHHQPSKAPIKVDYFSKQFHGNATFRMDNKFYLIDSAGNFEKYGSFDSFRLSFEIEGDKSVVLLVRSGKWGLFSMQKMDWVLAPQWERMSANWKGFYAEKEGKMGFIDARSLKQPAAYYDTVFQRSMGYYEARLGNQKIILDSNGNKIFESDADEVYHLNTGYFGDSNFVVKRGKQLFTTNGIQETPLVSDRVSLYYLFSTRNNLGTLVSKKGYILGSTDSKDIGNRDYDYDDEVQQNPDLGNGNWLIYSNGFEMVIDEEANVKIPNNYRSIVPYISVFGNYQQMADFNVNLEDSLKERRYLVRSKTYYQGLYDAQFNMVLDTLYWSINFRKNLVMASLKKGLYIKDSNFRDIAFIKDGRASTDLQGDRVTVIFDNSKKGVYQLSKGLILKPYYEEIIMEPNGIILAAKNSNNYDQPLVQIFDAKGKRLSRKRYTFESQGLGITTLTLDDNFSYLIASNGKQILMSQNYHTVSARVPQFTSYLSQTDTLNYYRLIDIGSILNTVKFTKIDESDFSVKVVNDNRLSDANKDVINQIFYETRNLKNMDITVFDTSISKIQVQATDNWGQNTYLRHKTYYFSADSIYRINAFDLILESTQITFATNFVSEITKDKNVKWNACVKPERLFSHLRFDVDFNAQGMHFLTYSFEDINGSPSKKEVFYTWQELAPYLNKDHVLAKRFFGLNQK